MKNKKWIKYADSSGKSGVDEFMLEDDLMKIRFKNNDVVYVYTASKPGKEKLNQMKILALNGVGLSTFISQVVKNNFDYTE